MNIEELVKSKGYNQRIMYISDYGSKVYGTFTEKSDNDIVVILDSDEQFYEVSVFKEYNLDLHIISFREFERLLQKHDIMALEVFYSNEAHLRKHFNFNIIHDTLRRSVSSVCGNSWSKARKKLEIPEESDYIAIKSLFHSIRILSYGIDLAKDGKIDFKNVLINSNTGEKITCENLWYSIQQKYESGWRWSEFKAQYTPLQNANATYFRKLAPLDLG